MKAPAAVLEDLMKQVRALLYTALPDRAWFTQQERVKATLTLPAKWLDDRKVELPAERYQKLAQLGKFPCIYLHSCVESHMRHHGDDYYAEGKGIRNRVKMFMSEIERAQVGADATVPILAKVHTEVAAAVSAGRRKPKSKPIAGPVQPDFLADLGTGDFAKVREETGLTGPNCEKSPKRPRRQNPAS